MQIYFWHMCVEKKSPGSYSSYHHLSSPSAMVRGPHSSKDPQHPKIAQKVWKKDGLHEGLSKILQIHPFDEKGAASKSAWTRLDATKTFFGRVDASLQCLCFRKSAAAAFRKIWQAVGTRFQQISGFNRRTPCKIKLKLLDLLEMIPSGKLT